MSELREAVILLARALHQLYKWQRKYGEHNPPWLPPAGDVELAEDIDAFLTKIKDEQP
jgi:hypothetical protein